MVALVIVVAALVFLTPVRRWATDLVGWVNDKGSGAAVVYAVLYVVAAVLLLPGSALTLGAGFVYGVVWGTVIVFPAAMIASLVAFGIARRLAQEAVQRRVARHRRFAALDRAVGRAGFKITVLLRLSPVIPYGLLNFALGVTSVRFRDYAVATAVGMLPGTVMYVYLGSLVTSASELGHSPDRGWLYWVGGAITVVAAIAVTLVGRRELRRELQEVPA
jgi:uncharacterized membrane protein YdjX (TVP38/TMEM64 family)